MNRMDFCRVQRPRIYAENIRQELEQFLAQGGQITELPAGLSTSTTMADRERSRRRAIRKQWGDV